MRRISKSAGSLSADSGLQLDLEIALSGFPAEVQPHGFLQPGRRCVETSGDVIGAACKLLPNELSSILCVGHNLTRAAVGYAALGMQPQCRTFCSMLVGDLRPPIGTRGSPPGPFHFFSNSNAAGKIIFSHSAYSFADRCNPSFATRDRSLPIFLLSGKTSTTRSPRLVASSVTI